MSAVAFLLRQRIKYLASDLGEDPAKAIDKAKRMLEEERRDGISPIQVIILYGDGCDPTVGACPGQSRASSARAEGAGMEVMAVCYSQSERETCARSYRQIVSNPSYYFETRASRLPQELEELQETVSELGIDSLNLTEILGPDINYIEDSGMPAPGGALPTRLFKYADILAGETISASYKIKRPSKARSPCAKRAASSR